MLRSVATTSEFESSLCLWLHRWNPQLPDDSSFLMKLVDMLMHEVTFEIASGAPGQPFGNNPCTRMVTLNSSEWFEWVAHPLAIIYKMDPVPVVIGCMPLINTLPHDLS